MSDEFERKTRRKVSRFLRYPSFRAEFRLYDQERRNKVLSAGHECFNRYIGINTSLQDLLV